ncbi:protein-export membrane protein SecD [Microbacterium sp. 1.5R]|uniref:protein translocase subunit SecD n=1 Tax=unclassified Microbacterium TaxID=2609290 RepID=UPI00069CD135|nr:MULTISPECIES: protein translocase subunit SecD [unclassified Microbacterium]AKV85620.1 preprotein translocase subunit SecD [Microbacterium sp. CGR1]APH45039.1 protein-export membrane protein SecD [Microbacterium sp. 1.5R]KRD52246.1 preprotein translocase subunit SecD [Microbacterium sp. Root280D1]MBC6494720.1 protein-export membrane protein SecD [Microbacterium sp. 4-7]MDY0982858.1 protein translocase subunit SecD [Microbacterium sp. CFBP9023]
MATSSPVRHAWRVLMGLLLVTGVLFGINALGVHVFEKSSWTPELALDLQGGTQIVLSAETEDGAAPSPEQLDQAAAIIRQRVDASGVAEADITTEGGRNIVVQIPGVADEQTRARIQSSAQLEFRPVLATTAGTNQYVGEDGNETAYPTPDDSLNATPTAEPTDASDLAWVTDRLAAEFQAYDCANPENDPSNAPKDQPLIACDPSGQAKYLLGPTELTGDAITDASAGRDPKTGAWLVQLTMNGDGAEAFGEVSTRLNQNRLAELSPRDQFAFVLDGSVISAPRMNGQILDGRPSISGDFNQESATALADQLKFGALPLSFEVQSSDTISATLGTQQLQIGLIAGLIGLALVAIYSLIVYRALGSVIIASIAVMAVLTYIIICILAWRLGFRLSLAGVAGLIVSIGFTADSFIVYFERIRDELRDGKSITSAVEDGWGRAKRTIYISKSINILAAVVLYILADSTVKGFAFTLGLTTLIDVFIFVIFTHPVMQLLARTKFFGGGHKLSGLDPESLGAVYRSRSQFRQVSTATAGRGAKNARAKGEAERRQTIAERKRAEALAGERTTRTGSEGDA